MAPSSGHILVPKAMKVLRLAISKTASLVRSRQAQASAANLEPVPALLRRQPIHPVAALRQSRSQQQRSFTTAIHRILSISPKAANAAARAFPTSAVRTALSKTTHAPFSSPLRPNLTGGALPRSAGGYSLGGAGVRHFSHIPASNAQVVNNVSAAVRAFCVNGYKAQYDGTDPRTGEKRFRAVTAAQEKATSGASFPNARGTTLEFHIAPTLTAISPLTSSDQTVDSSTVLSTLASDFARSLPSLALIHADLKRLSTLGSLPITQPTPSAIHVRFPGCDEQIVTAICDELNIKRGIIREDEAWAEEGGDKDVGMALLFPWAPSVASAYSVEAEEVPAEYYFQQQKTPLGTESLEWRSMLSGSESSPLLAEEQYLGNDSPQPELLGPPYPYAENEQSEGEGFDAVNVSELASNESFGMDLARVETLRGKNLDPMVGWGSEGRESAAGSGYEDMQGIWRFLAECEAAGRR